MTIAVVLGNRNNDDGTLSTIGTERMQATLQLLATTQIDSIILSGGIANSIANVSESQLMYDYLVEHNISPDRLIIEDNSLTTEQNAQYCAPIINSIMPDTVILVTSHDHMHRLFYNPIKLFAKHIDSSITLTPYTGGTL